MKITAIHNYGIYHTRANPVRFNDEYITAQKPTVNSQDSNIDYINTRINHQNVTPVNGIITQMLTTKPSIPAVTDVVWVNAINFHASYNRHNYTYMV